MMALELGGIVFVFLAVLCGVGVLLLALYFAAKLFEALLRFAVRQIRAKALTPSRTFYPATIGSSYERPAFHVTED